MTDLVFFLFTFTIIRRVYWLYSHYLQHNPVLHKDTTSICSLQLSLIHDLPPKLPLVLSLPVEQGLGRAIKWQKEEGGSRERGAGRGCASATNETRWCRRELRPKSNGSFLLKTSERSLFFKKTKVRERGKTLPPVPKVWSQSRDDDKRAAASLDCHYALRTNVNEYNSKRWLNKKKKKRNIVDKGCTAVILKKRNNDIHGNITTTNR